MNKSDQLKNESMDKCLDRISEYLLIKRNIALSQDNRNVLSELIADLIIKVTTE